jgi:hypothetical protein
VKLSLIERGDGTEIEILFDLFLPRAKNAKPLKKLAPNTRAAPGYPGFSIHTRSPGFTNIRATRSSASCTPETITTCSGTQFTPRELRR